MTATVELPAGQGEPPSATRALRAIVLAAVRQFPDVFPDLEIPDRRQRFGSRRRSARLLTTFEVARGSSARSAEVARFVADQVQRSFVLAGASRIPLERAFDEPATPLPFVQHGLGDPPPGYQAAPGPNAHALEAIVAGLEREKRLSAEAAEALRWTLRQNGPAGAGTIDLTREPFVLLGGTAELSPLALLLACGADVLTTHTSGPSLERSAWAGAPQSSLPGRLFVVESGVDLLASPVQFAESALAFAAGRRVHVGALAYKGGEGREWRLTAATDGIVRRLKRAGALASVSYYLSPSIVTEVSQATARESIARYREQRAVWKDAIRVASGDALFRPNIIEHAGRFWCDSLVTLQGTSYQAGNLFGKRYAAEAHVAEGRSNPAAAVPISANVAPISRTRSTDLPSAAAAFSELNGLGIDVFEPSLARTLMFHLMLWDLFGPGASSTAPVFARQIHGGVFTNAWALDSVLKLAYLRSLARRR